ncbi:MAG: hypothetical protein KC503_04910 [Myxococcales bacterium]|nr:hypothetical protein [Myxococcales bacterium]
MTTHTLRVRPDKIASVCSPFELGPYLSLRRQPVAEEGAAVVGRVLTVNQQYGHLELRSGRPAQLVPGDLIVGVLGARAALRGFCGRVPTKLEAGDELWLLNKGGVIGESDGATVGLGQPIRIEIIGTPERDDKPLRLSDYAMPRTRELPARMPPVLLVAATCMHSGKTTAAGAVTRFLTSAGLRVHAGKATGVAAVADLLVFADNGAQMTLSFLDAGAPSTCYRKDVPEITRTLLTHLAAEQPDAIVLELGDGLFGAYGVDEILDDKELAAATSTALVAANDVIGGWAAAERLRERGIAVASITGRATDNEAGRSKLRKLGYAANNIFQQAEELYRVCCEGLGIAVPEGARAIGPEAPAHDE